MGIVTSRDLIAALNGVADTMAANCDALCALDGQIGDADHGVAMDVGFSAVRTALGELGDDTSPTQVLDTTARSFLNAVGASSGPLYATAFMRAAAAVKGKTDLSDADAPTLIAAMADGIAHRGKASPGDKTMIDAWAPAADAAMATTGASFGDVFRSAAEAAQTGADATTDMQANWAGLHVWANVQWGTSTLALRLRRC